MATSADKKAEFREYLESSGVMDSIVKSLVLLYQEPTKPADPLAFVVSKLGGSVNAGGSCEEKDAKIAELTQQVEELKTKLGQHEPAAPGAASVAKVEAAPAAEEAVASVAEEDPEKKAEEAPPAE